jgi:hypothetical protein
MAQAQVITRATHGDSLADILERVLNTGVVIAGDIRVKLCDVELLSIQLRLLICSVEKAKELGVGWWWQEEAAHSDQAVPRADGPHKPLPASKPPTYTPWEEYKRFQEFQRFREAEHTFEEGAG